MLARSRVDSVSAAPWTVAVLVLAGLALTPGGAGGEETRAPKFRGGLELGASSLWRHSNGQHRNTTLYMAFTFGYAALERTVVGLELSGHLLEASNLWDPNEGAGVSQAFLVAQYYRQPTRSGLYLRGGAGWVSYWDNRPGGLESDGWCAPAGERFERPRVSLTVLLSRVWRS